ncbi:CoA pyrophosphatase [Flavobacteriaceae bacterium]|nr:CoA pyrophosphatase [Flavobacteriaceae bacterium]
MDFQTFINCISKVNDFPLPGKRGHAIMAPYSIRRLYLSNEEVFHHENDSEYYQNARKASVLLCFYEHKDELYLTLIKRTTYDGPHSGQISFPGGKPASLDSSLWDTAKREFKEELGVDLSSASPLLTLSRVYIPPSNFLVTPFVAVVKKKPFFHLDSREVALKIDISLYELIHLKIKQYPILEGNHKGVVVPCYVYEGHMIWGATAMVLSEFILFLKERTII